MEQYSLFVSLFVASVNAATPILIAALGLIVNERAGVLNLGAEGMMVMAAVMAFIVTYLTKSSYIGMLAGVATGVFVATFFALLTLGLRTNQVATGLAISIFAGGASAFIGQAWVGLVLPPPVVSVPYFSDIPVIGALFFQFHIVVYIGLSLCFLIAYFFYRTRGGLVLRAVGESPESAYALGYSVTRIRFFAILFGGMLCGLAGAYLSTVYTPLWVEGIVAGKGWIALALTTFATWRPFRAFLGAFLFGSIMIAQFYIQGLGVNIPSQLLSMLPYLATIFVLILISRNESWIRRNMPTSLGKNFVS